MACRLLDISLASFCFRLFFDVDNPVITICRSWLATDASAAPIPDVIDRLRLVEQQMQTRRLDLIP